MKLNQIDTEREMFYAMERLQYAIEKFDVARARLKSIECEMKPLCKPDGHSIEHEDYEKALRELGVAIKFREKAFAEWQITLNHPNN